MRFAISATLLSLAASVFAYQVTSPRKDDVWTSIGPNTFTWSSVSTDRQNFTLVLKNQDQSVRQVLAALVDRDLGTLSVNAPATGFPIGTDFQVNMVQDEMNLDAILAQSEIFTIKESPMSSSTRASQSSTGTANGSSGTATRTATTGTGAATGGNLNPTTSNSGTSPTNSPNAGLRLGAQSGLVSAAAAVLGAVAYLA